VPVSQKPRKTRHRTPPKDLTQRKPKSSPIKRFAVIIGLGILVFSIGLLSVFSPERQQQAAEQNNPNAQSDATTTTVLEPTGGIRCPETSGEARRDAFPATGVPQCLTIGHTYKARVTTDVGAFTIALDPTKAPASVNVFVVLARYHFYDDLTFHKAVPGFFIQSGDPQKEGVTGPGFTFDDQLPKKGEYLAGSVAMANQRVGANGSQFLVMVTDAPNLPTNYPLFGQIVEGIDVVKKIANDGDDKGNPKVTHRLLRVIIEESV
jgi:cyclophilin family peptidyl-prolyl cis-trans isomerase